MNWPDFICLWIGRAIAIGVSLVLLLNFYQFIFDKISDHYGFTDEFLHWYVKERIKRKVKEPKC